MADLKKLAYESPASQDGWEMWQVLKHVADLKPKVIVEIGVDGGGGLFTYQKAFPKAKVIGIDINERQELNVYDMIYADSRSPYTYQTLEDKLAGKPIDFLFIDGDHHYEFAKREFEMYSRLGRPGGIVGFHDTNNRGIEGVEVDQWMREMDLSHSLKTADFRTDRMSPGTRVVWLES